MSTISIKTYLLPEGLRISSVKKLDDAELEKRRFNLSLDETEDNFKNFMQKIKSVYGLKEEEELRTYWVDDENEFVCFSSDSEMQLALQVTNSIKSNQKTNDLFKVFIAILNKKAKDEGKNDVLHFGVICNGCSRWVSGVRRKCAQCFDFDLCEKCFRNQVHKETRHEFLTIEKPSNQFNFDAKQLDEMMKSFTPMISSLFGSKNFDGLMKDLFGACLNKEAKKEGQENKSKDEEFHEQMDKMMKNFMPFISELFGVKQNDSTNVDGFMRDLFGPGLNKEEKNEAKKKEEGTTSKDSDQKRDEEKKPNVTPVELLKNIATAFSQQNSAAPFMNDVDSIEIQKEIQIINAIEKLRSMGYSDDAGWLTSLATAKQGNLNDILDAISPAKH